MLDIPYGHHGRPSSRGLAKNFLDQVKDCAGTLGNTEVDRVIESEPNEDYAVLPIIAFIFAASAFTAQISYGQPSTIRFRSSSRACSFMKSAFDILPTLAFFPLENSRTYFLGGPFPLLFRLRTSQFSIFRKKNVRFNHILLPHSVFIFV